MSYIEVFHTKMCCCITVHKGAEFEVMHSRLHINGLLLYVSLTPGVPPSGACLCLVRDGGQIVQCARTVQESTAKVGHCLVFPAVTLQRLRLVNLSLTPRDRLCSADSCAQAVVISFSRLLVFLAVVVPTSPVWCRWETSSAVSLC